MRRNEGFLLLEVLVAFVIAAFALAALFHGSLDGLRASQAAGRYGDAIARARSHLAAIGATGPVRAGDSRGTDGGGYSWRVRIVPVASAPAPGAPPGSPPRLALYAVTVEISWTEDGHRRAVRLRSERVGQPPPRGV